VGFEVPIEATQKLWQLKNEANYVTTNLMKIINMETDEDSELNDLLDICLSKAKNINMRGDLIDACYAIKIFRDKLTKEVVEDKKQKGKFDENKFDGKEFFEAGKEEKDGKSVEYDVMKLFQNQKFFDNADEDDENESNSSFTHTMMSKSDHTVADKNHANQKGIIT
jgi:hypothetical protein